MALSTPPKSAVARDGTGDSTGDLGAPTVGRYLIDRLHTLGVEHIFGIPGDYVLTLLQDDRSQPDPAGGGDPRGQRRVCRRRLRAAPRPGLCVRDLLRGGFEPVQQHRRGLCREVAGDRISAARPGLSERARNPLLHHKVKGFETQFEVFEKITVASAVLDDPLHGLRRDRPGARGGASGTSGRSTWRFPATRSRRVRLGRTGPRRDCRRATRMPSARRLTRPRPCSAAARRPMILADVEIHRFGLQDDLLALAEETGHADRDHDPGQERHLRGAPAVRGRVRGGDGARRGHAGASRTADCLLMLGCFLTDINLGIFTAKLDPSRCIDANERRPADPAPSLQRRPARRLHPRAAGSKGLKLARTPIPPRPDPFDGALGARVRQTRDLGPSVRAG